MLRKCALWAAVILPTAVAAGARPVTTEQIPYQRDRDPIARPGTPGSNALSAGIVADTVLYGGTVWAADSMRWESARYNVWTFDTGVGSSINTGGNPNKPIGYHELMQGWFGIDRSLSPLPFLRRSSTCAINGSHSFWAGVTTAEAESLCYAAGQGYGNSWNLAFSKSFTYPGSGAVQLGYTYAVEAESGFDYAYVTIDTTGNGGQDDVPLAAYTGTVNGTAVHPLNPGTTMRSSAGPVTITFRATSDGSYSDEDGLNPTVCGHTAIDDIALSGAITDFSDFEAGANGWALSAPVSVGDYSNIVDRSTLPPPAVFCPCGLADSVLVFFDTTMQHPLDQDNIAVSPWIDLERGGDAGRPGKLIFYSLYSDLPIANYVYTMIGTRYYPYVCPYSSQAIISRFEYLTEFFPNGAPFCNGVGSSLYRDAGGIIPPSAEEVQIALGAINLCRTSPFGVPCTGLTNTTPWYDNVALGVTGSTVAPPLFLLTFDRLQDSFAEDGTLNPASTGRFDTNTIKDGSNPLPGTHLRDTLVARVGSSTNTEVRMWFMVRPGPFTNGTALAARAARWTPDPSIPPRPGAFGNTWYHARLDTAEQGGSIGLGGYYMSTFHESDPGFLGNDRTADPMDPNQLENEILPDHILTPGSRVDYFLAARYIPPDPRNAGGMNWYLEGDTTGGRYREAEILPSSMAADTTWNCVLYVDHHEDRSAYEQQIEEAGLTLVLGGGGNTAEGTRFDRWDVQTSSSGQLSMGRALNTNYGATMAQLLAYKVLVWHASTLSSVQLTDEDANVIRPWLTLATGNAFWGSGDGLVRSMSTSGEPATVSFMQEILGVLASCNTIREAGCPAGSLLDSTACIALTAAAGAHFATVTPTSAAGNGCPALRSFDVNGVNPAVPTARGQLAYTKNGSTVNFMSVTNRNTLGWGYRTVTDGVALGALRTTTATPHDRALCSADPTAAHDRTAEVLNWFGAPTVCDPILITSAVGEDPVTGAPTARTTLGLAAPNPMNAASRIRFESARNGTPIRIEILDVTGRLVRSLVDAPFDAGPHSVVWDGANDAGRRVASGLYFYRFSADGRTEAKKLVVHR